MDSSNSNENKTSEMEKDPLDVSPVSVEPPLIKEAQNDVAKIDILVCGGCHGVYHFVDEFKSHKESDECVKTPLVCENEEKSQIWGFTLWKTKEFKKLKSEGLTVPTSWEIYQKWTKLDKNEKELWVTTGKNVQFIHKLAAGKVKEVSATKEKDPLALEEVDTGGPRRGIRTNKDNEREEYNVEQILGKKFNPRKRIWEYEVKWENYEESSWEPLSNLDNCGSLVNEFERKLKAEKEAKEKERSGRGRGRPRLSGTPGAPATPRKVIVRESPIVDSPDGRRPQRTSKQKALNQVKQWCGNISDEENSLKRHHDDDDSDDSFEKRMKLEEDDDTEEDEVKRQPIGRPKVTTKIIHSYNNGTGNKLPANVLVPDAKGVVRISQKQLPSLSSGVYIMSKSSGIIKLDPTASKIATSGGQAIVKVSPKIGQTQIRIIKKDDGTTKKILQMKQGNQSGTPTLLATPAKPKVTPIIVQQKSSPMTQIVRKEMVKKVMPKPGGTPSTPKTSLVGGKPNVPKSIIPKPQLIRFEKKDNEKPLVEDDSDDGLPELEFPNDLPLPVPESPPSDFTLDPFTGKVVGVEYPVDLEPVIHEEKPEEKLDNIVKLAAADITEDDLKVDEAETSVATTSDVATATTTTTTVEATLTTDSVVTATVVTTDSPKEAPSILSTAMANSNILQRTLQTPKAKPQPKILNQSVATKPKSTFSPLLKTTNHQPRIIPNALRQKQVIGTPPKPKFNISSPVKSAIAKTNIIAKKPAPVKRTPMKPQKPINMPSLDEDAPMVVRKSVQKPIETAVETNTFAIASGDRPMFITGDDGTIYQVAGQNEEGQTILVTQDSEGQQQCLLVTSEALTEVEEETQQIVMGNGDGEGVVMAVESTSEEQPMVAQVLRTEPPSPGGTHKVVVMLPNGEVMVTQVTPEEYASLELDK